MLGVPFLMTKRPGSGSLIEEWLSGIARRVRPVIGLRSRSKAVGYGVAKMPAGRIERIRPLQRVDFILF